MGKLFVVGTPIGNLGDMSPRAIDTLNSVDFIAAEDTRVTAKLLNHFAIKKPMISYFEHNKKERGEIICAKIISGETCALVTDAGMPAISDPGEELIRQCGEKNIKVEVVPGPSAVIAALAVSGLPTGRFTFEGFLSMNKKSRKEHLEQIKDEPRTMVFYEAPHKLFSTLLDLRDALGDRKISIVREITKIYEEVIRTNLDKAVEDFKESKPKGEIVLVIDGKKQEKIKSYTIEEAVYMAEDIIKSGIKASEAARQAAKTTGLRKGMIYKELIEKS